MRPYPPFSGPGYSEWTDLYGIFKKDPPVCHARGIPKTSSKTIMHGENLTRKTSTHGWVTGWVLNLVLNLVWP